VYSPQTIERLILYRRILEQMLQETVAYVYSHELAKRIGATAAQVRRDLMAVEYMAVAARGYKVEDLLKAVEAFLEAGQHQCAVLVGVGNLGRALLAHFSRTRASLRIVAAFDQDPSCAGVSYDGCPCYEMDALAAMTKEKQARIGVLTVPAEAAQDVAESLVGAGVRGILNFAPRALHLPEEIWIENIDVTRSLEKVAYFACVASQENAADTK